MRNQNNKNVQICFDCDSWTATCLMALYEVMTIEDIERDGNMAVRYFISVIDEISSRLHELIPLAENYMDITDEVRALYQYNSKQR